MDWVQSQASVSTGGHGKLGEGDIPGQGVHAHTPFPGPKPVSAVAVMFSVLKQNLGDGSLVVSPVPKDKPYRPRAGQRACGAPEGGCSPHWRQSRLRWWPDASVTLPAHLPNTPGPGRWPWGQNTPHAP